MNRTQLFGSVLFGITIFTALAWFVGLTPQTTQAQTTCPAENFLDVQPHPANSEYPDPTLNAFCNSTSLIVDSNGIPNFEFVPTTPNQLQAQNFHWVIPLTPTTGETQNIPLLGPVAVTVTGLPIFGPNENANDGYGDPYLDGILDFCNGHTAQGGLYHFHAKPECIFQTFEGQVGLVVGYGFDGRPILAPFICEDVACTSVIELQSSWQVVNPQATNAWEYHGYVAGSGDLDECNGMVLDDGSYAYFATDTFPYYLGCYRGDVPETPLPTPTHFLYLPILQRSAK